MNAPTPTRVHIDATTFGAVGDDATDDTAAIQRAIDTAADASGGTVVLRAGVFRAGHLRLHSNVTLRVEPEATLANTASNTFPYFVDPTSPHPETRLGWIVATGATDVAIEGGGVIDGRGHDFDDDHRPIAIKFLDCTRVRVSSIRLRRSPSWMLQFARCSQVAVNAIDIWSHVQRNNDGIDIDSSCDVTVANCTIDCGDDAIAIKSNYPSPTRNVIVTGCRLSSEWAAIRLGPESKGDFDNICVSNCVIARAWGTGIKLQMCEGATIRNVIFSSIVMSDVTGPFMIRLAGWREGAYTRPDNVDWESGRLEDIIFSDIVADVTDKVGRDPNWPEERYSASSITGVPGMQVTRVRFNRITVRYPGNGTAEHADAREVPERVERYPEYTMFGVLPASAFYIRHARCLRFDDVTLLGCERDARPAFVLDDADDSEFSNVTIDGEPFDVPTGA